MSSCMERIDLNGGHRRGGEHPLRPLAGRPQSPERPWVASDVFLFVFQEKLPNAVFHHFAVKIVAAKVGVASRGLDLEDTPISMSTPGSMLMMETSKVPPPRSNMSTVLASLMC